MPLLKKKESTPRQLRVKVAARAATAEETNRQRLAVDRLLEVWAGQLVQTAASAHQQKGAQLTPVEGSS